MNELQVKQLSLLNDTIAYFNLFNLCMDDGRCQYSPIKGRSEGCAIGRKLPLELAQKLDKEFTFSPYENNSICDREVFNLMPDELKELGQSFLAKLQSLHDDKSNWNEDGLSGWGKKG